MRPVSNGIRLKERNRNPKRNRALFILFRARPPPYHEACIHSHIYERRNKMNQDMTQKEKHIHALNSFAEKVKKDPCVIALLLYGSLAYGTVWEKSDLDVELIVRDGTIAPTDWVFIEEEGVKFEITGFQQFSKFKTGLQKMRGGFDHGMYGGGTLVFSKDEALQELFEETRRIGEDDAPRAFAGSMNVLINWMHKAEKHITVMHEPLYAQRFLQLCAATFADMVLLQNKENPNRESILRARQLEPDLMDTVYVKPGTTIMTAEEIRHTLKVIDGYLVHHMPWWSKHIIRFLNDGEPKTYSHISKQCGAMPMEYLAEKGVVMQVTQPIRLFKKSKTTVEEVAYVYIKEENND